jgi:hypothetical protein
MRSNDTEADDSAFAALCSEEFQLQPRIAFTKRLGRLETGRIQPLLVVLIEWNQASSANQLGKGAEAVAAYRMQKQRGLSRQRRANQNVGISSDNGLTVQAHESGDTMCTLDGVLPQHQSVIYYCNRMTLNPQSNTFNPPAPTVTVFD